MPRNSKKFLYKIVKLDVTGDKIPDGDLIIQYNTKTGIEKYKYVSFKVIDEKVIKPAFEKAKKKTAGAGGKPRAVPAMPAGYFQTPNGRIFRGNDVNKQQPYVLDYRGDLHPLNYNPPPKLGPGPIATFDQNLTNPTFAQMQANEQQINFADNTGFKNSFGNAAGTAAGYAVVGGITAGVVSGLDALFSS